ncbi:MAG: sugar phosphate nucleotidyltransferase, partial [Candidatus Bipolaricaulia bacterium]
LIDRFELDEDLLIVGGDNILELDFGKFISAYHGRPLLALYDIGDRDRVRGRYGVALVEDGKIEEFQEKPEEPRSTLVSTACYIYPPSIFPLIGEFLKQGQKRRDAPGYLNQWLLKRGVELAPFVFRGEWFDIGDRASYIAANLHYLDNDLYLGADVRIDHSTVRRSVILDNVSIKDSLIEDSVIDEGAELVGLELRGAIVGAGARIRRG